MATYYLAVDLGADSGRLILGTLDNQHLSLEEIHRFPNGPVEKNGSLQWNIQGLFDAIKEGLKKAAARNLPIASISCDTWGVDYLLFDKQGAMIEPTYQYRDARCPKGAAELKSRIPWEKIYEETGLQFLVFNTVFQLNMETRERLDKADKILLVGDGLNYMLSGNAKSEVSLASTTQFYNPRQRAWSKMLLDAVKVRPEQLAPIVQSGTKLGPIKPGICKETGIPSIEVVASCSHDTGAAVAAVPASGKNWAYLSSGTWSLIGVELEQPLITAEGRDANFTNEIGVGHSVRFLKNIIGLWLVQESRREWERAGQKYSFADLEKMAREAKPFVSLINPSDARFLSPGQMPQKIAALCKETGQPEPTTPGAVIRCVYESLALYYRHSVGNLEKITGRKIEKLHIVGGGSKDNTLNQFTASACQIPVVAGPAEATATGNILIQALALGHLPSLDAARKVVATSMAGKVVKPKDGAKWEAAYARFTKLIA
jgi:rhamnulokinase